MNPTGGVITSFENQTSCENIGYSPKVSLNIFFSQKICLKKKIIKNKNKK